jgi:hypothetical protein
LRRNCLLKDIIERKAEERIGVIKKNKEEDVSCYYMTVRKREDTGTGS